MATIDGKATKLTFGGVEVGGMVRHDFFQGVAREVLHRPLAAENHVVLPGVADFGRCAITLYRDKEDPGQLKMEQSLRNGIIENCVLTYDDESSDSFQAFCLLLPISGSKDSTSPVNASTAILRISGSIISP